MVYTLAISTPSISYKLWPIDGVLKTVGGKNKRTVIKNYIWSGPWSGFFYPIRCWFSSYYDEARLTYVNSFSLKHLHSSNALVDSPYSPFQFLSDRSFFHSLLKNALEESTCLFWSSIVRLVLDSRPGPEILTQQGKI